MAIVIDHRGREVRRSDGESAFSGRHIEATASQVSPDTTAAKHVLYQHNVRQGRAGHVPGWSLDLKKVENPPSGFHHAHVGRMSALAVPLGKRRVGMDGHGCPSRAGHAQRDACRTLQHQSDEDEQADTVIAVTPMACSRFHLRAGLEEVAAHSRDPSARSAELATRLRCQHSDWSALAPAAPVASPQDRHQRGSFSAAGRKRAR